MKARGKTRVFEQYMQIKRKTCTSKPTYAGAGPNNRPKAKKLKIAKASKYLLHFVSRMKRFVWKEVPNPNKCSWAKGLDFKKVKERAALFN